MSDNQGRLAVLLATRNGERHLQAQLRSVLEQDRAAIDIWASDDGSSDGTMALLADWARRWPKGRFTVLAGPQRGFAENFRSLLVHPDIAAEQVAFCDQDDVWLPGKISTAAATLAASGGRPALVCGRTRLIDEDGTVLGQSPLFAKPPGFANALVQSIAGANTMVLNRAGHQLMREAARRTGFVSHDWFCYLIISGAGGDVRYLAEPSILYRQHADNLVGANRGWSAGLDRLRRALGGRFTEWNDSNLRALHACEDLLTDEARSIIAAFEMARQSGSRALPERLAALRRSGVHRQTASGQLWLTLAAILGKI